ncbi:hypothetical protein CHS0354_008080 [Potamilus streckersoni]|uniref:Uncharacterized protein n=1 Tax=Potamilus streckersoni TaxID=2493646 RepID=A0AAE0S875_9BIVA|nr:hypothetical protein CHS0354_008080 [Potamilus streckersoni]
MYDKRAGIRSRESGKYKDLKELYHITQFLAGKTTNPHKQVKDKKMSSASRTAARTYSTRGASEYKLEAIRNGGNHHGYQEDKVKKYTRAIQGKPTAGR